MVMPATSGDNMDGRPIDKAIPRSIEAANRTARRVGIALVGPALGLIIAINILPAFYGFYSSLRKVFFFQDDGFIGLQNYIELFQSPLTWQAIGRSLVYTFGS